MHRLSTSIRASLLRERLSIILNARSSSSAAGVVRVVKPSTWTSREGVVEEKHRIDTSLLENQPLNSSEKSDRVTNDVRVSHLFRKYKQDPSNAVVLMSVIDSLASLSVESELLTRFPGFIHLITDVCKCMNRNGFSVTDVVSITENLAKLGIKNVPGKSNGIEMNALSTGLSNQLVSHLESLPKIDLINTLRLIECEMKIPLDNYFYYCLSKELIDWATVQTKSMPNETYVREVLGPLQNLTLEPIFKRTFMILDHPSIQSKMIELIKSKSLNHLLTVELISNLQAADKTKFFSVIQAGISQLLNGPGRDRLSSNIFDYSVIVSSLPNEPLLRDSTIQSDLESMLVSHLSTPQTDSRSNRKILESVSDLVVSNGGSAEGEILRLAAPLISNNISVLSQIPANKLSNLFYIFSKGSVDFAESSFRTVCGELEGFVIGKLPALSAEQLSKLSLTFASRIVNHPNSFRALGASIRRRLDSFSATEYTNAVFGLAYGGLLVKSALVSSINDVAATVPTNYLPKLTWSIAVAELSTPSTWDILMSRIEKEILTKPDMLGSLTPVDESHLYEALVAAKVNNYTQLSRPVERRLAQFDTSRKSSESEQSSAIIPLLTKLDVPVKVDVLPPSGGKFTALAIPAYVPEYRLILDLTNESTVHPGSGVTGGSAKLRHSLWSNLGYNVIAVSDSQFANCVSDEEKISSLKNILDQFVVELSELPKNPVEPETTGRDRLNRLWRSRTKEEETPQETSWESRPTNRKPRLDHNSKWTSRA